MTTRRGETIDGDRPTLRVRGPGDLVQLVPYLLGFHPVESLVILGMAGGSVVVTVRIDLADLVDIRQAVLASTMAAMAGGGAEVFIGVVVDDRAVPDGARPDPPLPWHGLVDALRAEAERCGGTADDVLLVSGGRWWSLCCAEAACCPPEGTPLDDIDSEVPATAAYAGLVALPDRAALAALLDPAPSDESVALLPRLAQVERTLRAVPDRHRHERSVKRALFAAARTVDAPGVNPQLSADDLLRFGSALSLISVRDAVWLAVDDQRLDGRELWRELGRRLPGRYAAAPLFLFGWASWRHGNGALARIAADRALAVDPRYTAADLLDAALAQGIDPRRMPRLRQRSA